MFALLVVVLLDVIQAVAALRIDAMAPPLRNNFANIMPAFFVETFFRLHDNLCPNPILKKHQAGGCFHF